MKKFLNKKLRITPAIMLLAILLTFGMSNVSQVRAASISDQINQLRQQNAANQSAVDQLASQAVSYQDAINRLQAQITLLQGQINDNLAKQTELQNKIVASQTELDRERNVLGQLVRQVYLGNQMTVPEMLATSKNFSDFVDKEEYRTAVGNKIQDTLIAIQKLQDQLKDQKVQIESLLAQQQSQQNELAGARAQQSQMLSYNQSQQSAYNQQTMANQTKIAALIAEQARANNSTPASGYYFLRFPGTIAAHDPNVNDYPYSDAGFGMSTAPGCVDNDGPDRWGYCTRQCVSYAAWAVERSGRSAPTYYGNAKDWIAAARNDGVPVYTDPQPGDVAISTSGTWGHAMYVEAVSGNQIFVSQYNQQLTGQYSTQWRAFR